MCLLTHCYDIHVTPSQTKQRAPAKPPSGSPDADPLGARVAVSPTCPPPPTPHTFNASKPATQRPLSSQHTPASAHEGSRERSTAGPCPLRGRTSSRLARVPHTSDQHTDDERAKANQSTPAVSHLGPIAQRRRRNGSAERLASPKCRPAPAYGTPPSRCPRGGSRRAAG